MWLSSEKVLARLRAKVADITSARNHANKHARNYDKNNVNYGLTQH
jgi:hypothetical protein